jgi:hypothetical protein
MAPHAAAPTRYPLPATRYQPSPPKTVAWDVPWAVRSCKALDDSSQASMQQ